MMHPQTGGGGLWIAMPKHLFSLEFGVINPHTFNFYIFGCDIHPLGEVDENDKVRDNPRLIQIMRTAALVAQYFKGNDFCQKYLPSAGDKLTGIRKLLNEKFLEPEGGGSIPEIVGEYWAKRLQQDVQEFETVLDDELKKLPIFCCDDDAIGNFSVSKLLKGASKGYPEKTRKHLTHLCCGEIDEAGKCLVYERSTAAGFHILRSVELTIIQYLTAIPGFVLPPLNRQNWGQYLQLLKDNGAIKEVTDHLYNIKDNYRNPLMHPEDTLEMPEAVSLFSVAQSMNEMLIRDMEKKGLIK
jgi:hypothetical protein